MATVIKILQRTHIFKFNTWPDSLPFAGRQGGDREQWFTVERIIENDENKRKQQVQYSR